MMMAGGKRRARWRWEWCAIALGLGVLASWTRPTKGEDAVSRTSQWLRNTPRPAPVEPVAPERLEASLARGLDFLLQDQNADGSWGSATRTKGLNIFAPIPGAHQAFRAAVTSLCLSALIESGDRRPEVTGAIERGWIWLARHLPEVRRADQEAIYNVWTHAYAISALVDLHRYYADQPPLQERALRLIEHQIEMLDRYEGINGGWGYYDFGAHTQQPNAEPTSFTTATALIALHEASTLGVTIPERLRQRAVRSLERQMKPDFSYYYSDNGPVSNRPMWEINRPGGSLGRSQACNLALRLWGDRRITDQVLDVWLDRLFARNLWLDIGRKRPVPHESYFLVAGYFFYYGHFYAAQCIEQLPAEDRAAHQAQLAHLLLELQEKDGSWWDFPFYDYHQPYGTAMAVMALVRCRAPATAVADSRSGL